MGRVFYVKRVWFCQACVVYCIRVVFQDLKLMLFAQGIHKGLLCSVAQYIYKLLLLLFLPRDSVYMYRGCLPRCTSGYTVAYRTYHTW